MRKLAQIKWYSKDVEFLTRWIVVQDLFFAPKGINLWLCRKFNKHLIEKLTYMNELVKDEEAFISHFSLAQPLSYFNHIRKIKKRIFKAEKRIVISTYFRKILS